MSVTQVPLQPVPKATKLRLVFGLFLLLAAGAALAWVGAGQMRPEVSATGVAITTIKAGEGPLITAQDGVVIAYVGRLPDGKEFDRADEAPLLVGQVVPGFAEALQRMQPGGQYKVRIPPELAYGANPPPGGPIPPNSPLDFDITVKRVVPGAALQMMGQMGPGGPPPQGQ